jgi:hypothetical protein
VCRDPGAQETFVPDVGYTPFSDASASNTFIIDVQAPSAAGYSIYGEDRLKEHSF